MSIDLQENRFFCWKSGSVFCWKGGKFHGLELIQEDRGFAKDFCMSGTTSKMRFSDNELAIVVKYVFLAAISILCICP